VKKFRSSHMQQSTACLHFVWRTTSLRVGGRAARRSCLPGLRRDSWRRRSTGRRDSLVVSGVAVRTECARPLDRFILRRSASGGRTAPPTHFDTDQTQNSFVWWSGRLNSHRHTRHDKTVLSVSCLAWRCELDNCC